MKWLERKFTFDLPLGWYPALVERMRGTPPRLEERVRGLSEEVLTGSIDGAWSIKEHVGHLTTVEELWEIRHDEFLAGKDTLFAAHGPKTGPEPDHNAASIQSLLAGFREARAHFVQRLEAVTPEEIGRTAMHPRLNQSIRLMDSVFFAAEHDDHHLARISELIRTFTAK